MPTANILEELAVSIFRANVAESKTTVEKEKYLFFLYHYHTEALFFNLFYCKCESSILPSEHGQIKYSPHAISVPQNETDCIHVR